MLFDQVQAPWSDDQVDALNAWQQLDHVHPFTCPEDHLAGAVSLVATPTGWVCPQGKCKRTQSWAYRLMLDASQHPANPLQL
jgi:hypothetical protein